MAWSETVLHRLASRASALTASLIAMELYLSELCQDVGVVVVEVPVVLSRTWSRSKAVDPGP